MQGGPGPPASLGHGRGLVPVPRDVCDQARRVPGQLAAVRVQPFKVRIMAFKEVVLSAVIWPILVSNLCPSFEFWT
jgi:hypothetical protein